MEVVQAVSRLFVICEGQTEETFVNEVLAPHLYAKGWLSVSARIMGNARLRRKRGGVKGWPAVRDDILRHLKADKNCYLTTLVDYYALPQSGIKAWPGRAAACGLAHSEKGELIEREIIADLSQALGNNAGEVSRVIPFILIHEFEALCFADCEAFSNSIGEPALAAKMSAIREQFESPEEINDSPETAPSKRILSLYPEYQKPLAGNIELLGVGLEAIRSQCEHFSDWLGKLEAVVT